MVGPEFPIITVLLADGTTTHRIVSVGQAVDFLANCWPSERNDRYAIAQQACRDALKGNCSIAAARAAFIDAAREAGIFVDYGFSRRGL